MTTRLLKFNNLIADYVIIRDAVKNTKRLCKKKKYIMTYIMTSQLEKSELQKSDFSAEVHFV